MKMTLTYKTEFELLAMRSLPNGFELEFTETPGSSAMSAGSYSINRWTHAPQWGYHSGRHQKARGVSVKSVEKGRKENRVTLVLSPGDLKHEQGGKLIQSTIFRVDFKGVQSAGGKSLHTKSAWYTLNEIGPGVDAEDYPKPVAVKQREKINSLNLFVISSTLHLRGTGVVKAKLLTVDGRVLEEINATAPAVLPLAPMPNGVHFLTGTLDGVHFSKKVVAAN
jgi:hypothetical protein